ncbi:MAG: MOSC domain-containing protein [Burkholderiales bacterium]
MKENSTIQAVFLGAVALLPPEGHRTGMFKRQVAGRVAVTTQGLEGDQQADRRFHGGPEKALHHYAAENYAHLSRRYPPHASEFVPGSLGENLSTCGWSESDVHIGDVFRAGETLLQVSQPRSPCWKINHRFGIGDLSMTVAKDRVAGWYYRVLRPGSVVAGDPFDLVERQDESLSIHDFWRIWQDHRPSIDDLMTVCSLRGLAAGWREAVWKRASWLKQAGLSH